MDPRNRRPLGQPRQRPRYQRKPGLTTSAQLRKSGIDLAGDVPWGTHFCLLYETKDDLIDILIPYFKAGLENHELCVWIVSDPFNEEEVRNSLTSRVPAATQHLAAGDIEIIHNSDWYFKDGIFSKSHAIARVGQKLEQARAQGYAGVRVNGDESWLTNESWQSFSQYEMELAGVTRREQILLICTYRLHELNALQLFDVARAHQFAVARRNGNWEILELERVDEDVEKKVRQRTTALAEANQKLQQEIVVRQETETALREASAKILRSQDEERRRLAHELHDGMAQLFTALVMNLGLVNESADRLNPSTRDALNESIAIADRCLRELRLLSFLLYPPDLDELGLRPVLIRYAEGFQQRSGIQLEVEVPDQLPGMTPELTRALFFIVQESLTNVYRHSGSGTAAIRMTVGDSNITLEIKDKGRGVQEPLRAGVGIASIRERVQEFGGAFDLLSNPDGTTVKALIPLHPHVR